MIALIFSKPNIVGIELLMLSSKISLANIKETKRDIETMTHIGDTILNILLFIFPIKKLISLISELLLEDLARKNPDIIIKIITPKNPPGSLWLNKW